MMSRPCQHTGRHIHALTAYMKNLFKAFKSKNEGLYQRVIKARWIKACLVSSKGYGITITKLLVLFHVSYKVVVVKQWLLHNIAEKKVQKQERKVIENKRCRNGVQKST